VVVCAHGYSGNARDFDDLARTLSRDARVICVDVAGRGRSEWLGSSFDYNFPLYLAGFDALFAHLGLDEVEWIGTSMGGLLGMHIAARPANPIRRLVMNDVGAFVPMEALCAIAGNLRGPERFDSLEAVESHMRRTHRDWGRLTARQWGRLARHGARRDADGWRLHYDPRLAPAVEPLPLAPGLFFWDAWYKTRCPALLLRGERSEVFPRYVAETMLRMQPAAALVEIEGCGHAPSLMGKGQIDIVRRFLAKPSARMARAWPVPSLSSPSSKPASSAS
jgi:pimeloyl-ACP methyl ester carboxylesterase